MTIFGGGWLLFITFNAIFQTNLLIFLYKLICNKVCAGILEKEIDKPFKWKIRLSTNRIE